jgi:hypothetical protein
MNRAHACHYLCVQWDGSCAPGGGDGWKLPGEGGDKVGFM